MPPAAAFHPLTPFSPGAGPAAFWLFVAVCVVTSLLIPILQHRESQKTIRLAIEKGDTLDPAVLERLLRTTRPSRPAPEQMLVGGLVVCACGPGLAVMGWFIGHIDPKAIYPLFGVGVLLTLVGLALILGALINMKQARARGVEGGRGG